MTHDELDTFVQAQARQRGLLAFHFAWGHGLAAAGIIAAFLVLMGAAFWVGS
jgi:hypothetical protein